MKIMPNELEIIENCIKEGLVDKKPTNTIKLYARYLWVKEQGKYKKALEEIEIEVKDLEGNKRDKKRQKEISKYKKHKAKEFYEIINEFLIKNYGDYNEIDWEELVKGIIKTTLRNENPIINNVKEVKIYKSEIEFIKNIKGEKFQKLAFTYLVYARLLYKLEGKNKECWVDGKHQTEIFKDAKVTDKGRLQLEDIHKMYKNGILELSFINSNNNVRITFNEKENKEIGLIVNDFRELGLQWLEYCDNKKIKRCEVCGKRFISKNIKNTSQKYCTTCKKDIERDKDRNKKRKKRSLSPLAE